MPSKRIFRISLGDIKIIPGIRIGDVEDGICSLTDAHRLWVADVRKRSLEDAAVVKHVDPLVAAIAGVDVALRLACLRIL